MFLELKNKTFQSIASKSLYIVTPLLTPILPNFETYIHFHLLDSNLKVEPPC